MKLINYFFVLTGVILIVFFNGCKENDETPAIETTEIVVLGHKTAMAGGDVTAGENLTVRGLCWSTTDKPTIENDRYTREGLSDTVNTLLGSFTALMTSLKPNTTYYYRAYVDDCSSQLTYGRTYSFTTLSSKGTVNDVEGNIYQTAQIGNQLWMAENLKSKHFSNGDEIPTTVPDTLHIGSGITIGYQWTYNSSDSLAEEYGRLYNWYIVIDTRNICPVGWHVPNDNEWNIMLEYLGGDSLAANKLKEAGSIHWESDYPADNNSDFTALPGGYREANGFSNIGGEANFWSSTIYPSDNFFSYRLIANPYVGVLRNSGGDGNAAYSIRCIKD